ncbi:MAG: hypothetical protein Q8O40_05960, partial [Chloroflexota bacterium]|nr:hypothetical protein [Chloroflexota bacterium]
MPLNPWLAAKLALIPNSWPEDVSLSLIVETPPGLEQLVQTQLGEIAGVRVGRRARNYIEAVVPLPFIRRVSNLTGVFMVHYNMPTRIVQFEPPLRPTLSLPFLDQLVTRFDPLVGYVTIDDVVVPRKLIGPDMLLPFSPMRILARYPLGEFEFIPTIRSRDVLLDVPTTLTGRGVTVAVLDTGWAPLVSIYRGKALSTCSTDPQPLDGHGHGSWVNSAAVGSRDVGPLGTCLGVAP